MKKSSSPMPCCLASVLTSSTRLSRTVLVRAGRGVYQKLLPPPPGETPQKADSQKSLTVASSASGAFSGLIITTAYSL